VWQLDHDKMTITPYKGNITVQAGSLFFEQWNPSDWSSDYFTNKVPITFTNGNATINFGTQIGVTTAPPDTDERSVTFINRTSCGIILTFKNIPAVSLSAATQFEDTSATVTNIGEDIVLTSIVFSNALVQADPSVYVELSGSVEGGDNQDKEGIALKSGTIIISPIPGVPGNPAGF